MRESSARRPNRRAAVLRAAATVIARRGVRGLRVDDVAREAGASPPLLYYHFPDRLALLRAALDHANLQAPSTNLLAARPDGPGLEAVEVALLSELDERPAVRDLSVIWNEVSAAAVFEPELRADMARVTAVWNARVAAAIRHGIRDGSIPAHVAPDAAAEALTALVEGASQRWLAHMLPLEDARAIVRDGVRVLLAP